MNPGCLLPALFSLLTALATAAPPTMNVRAEDHRLGEGTPLILHVGVGSQTPFTMRWEKDGQELPGQIFRTLGIGNAQLSDSGVYVPIASNDDGDTRGKAVRVTVVPNPIGPFEVVQPAIAGSDVRYLENIDGTFLMSNHAGALFWSTDGEVWTDVQLPSFAFGTRTTLISSVVRFQDRYYAFQGSSFPGGWVSDDLRTWDYLPALPSAADAVASPDRVLIRNRIPDFTSTTLQVSTDLSTWTPAPEGAPRDPETLNFFNGLFVATWFGGVSTSPDGLNWTLAPNVPAAFEPTRIQQRLPVINGALTSANRNTLFRSTNGINWTETTITTETGGSNPLFRLDFLFAAHDRFWAAGASNLFSSTDLLQWSPGQEITSPLTPFDHPITAAAGSEDLLIVGSTGGVIARSTDPANVPTLVSEVSFGGFHVLADLLIGAATPRFFRSSDSNDWEVLTQFEQPRQFLYHDGVYVSAENSLSYSFDARDWRRPARVGGGNDTEEMLAAGNGVFVAESLDQFFLWSDTGTEWTLTDVSTEGFGRVTFLDGQFIAYGTTSGGGGTVINLGFSTDGLSWRREELRPVTNAWAVGIDKIGETLVLATIDPSEFFLSTDNGEEWQAVDTGLGWLAPSATGREEQMSSLAVHNGHFVVAGQRGSLLYSTDGLDWSLAQGPLNGGNASVRLENYKGALFADEGVGQFVGRALLRSGPVRPAPVIAVDGLDESSEVTSNDLRPLEIEVTGMLPGDRLEVRHNSLLLAETTDSTLYLPWRVGPTDRQVLRVTVVHADGFETSRTFSFDVGPPAAEFRCDLTPDTRLRDTSRAGGFFFGGAARDRIRYAADLLHWTEVQLPEVPDQWDFSDFARVASTDGTNFVLVASGRAWSSRGLDAWQSFGPIPDSNIAGATSLGSSADYVIYVENDRDNRRNVFRTRDGSEWEGPVRFQGNPADDFELHRFGDRAVAAFEAPGRSSVRVMSTLDAQSWTSDLELPDSFLVQARSDADRFVVLTIRQSDNRRIIHHTTDLQTWDELPIPFEVDRAELFALGNDLLTVRARNGLLWITTDFQTGQPHPAPFETGVLGEPYWLDDRWVNSSRGRDREQPLYTSPDLTTWRVETAVDAFGNVTAIEPIGYDLVFHAGPILSILHPDGRWEHTYLGVDIQEVERWNGQWVIASEFLGVAMLGPNGATYHALPADFRNRLRGLHAMGDHLVVVAQTSSFWTTDGVNWDERPHPQAREPQYSYQLGDTLILSNFWWTEDQGQSWTMGEYPDVDLNSRTPISGFYEEGGWLYHVVRDETNWRSLDGKTWEVVPEGVPAGLPRPIRLEAATIGGIGATFLDPDGIDPAVVLVEQGALQAASYYRGRYLGVGDPEVGSHPKKARIVPLADLAPTIDEPLPSPGPGEEFTISFSIENFGFDSAFLDQPLRIDLHLSSNTTFGDGDDVPLGRLYHGSTHRHRAGESVPFTLTARLPTDLPPESFYLALRLYDADLTLDYNLANNTTFSPVPLLFAPDLGGGSTTPSTQLDLALQQPDADHDHDTWPNLLEHLLGSDPLQADSSAPWSILRGSTGELTLRFRQRIGHDAALLLETSSELRSWSSVPPSAWTLLEAGDEFVTWQIALPGESRTFFRFVIP